jgi:hypothetical protein
MEGLLITPKTADIGSQGTNAQKSFIRTRAINEDTFEDIFNIITTAPGAVVEIGRKELLNFGWRNKDGHYEVTIPSNLERFSDNWPVRCAVAAAKLLDATIIAGDDLAKFEYLPDKAEYFHGLAAVMKESCSKQVPADKTTGLFHQGFRWGASKVLSTLPNSGLFRLKWHDPYFALIGREVWTGDVPDYVKRWHSLVTEACKHIKLADASQFAKSFEEINSAYIKHEFVYERRAVFSVYEVQQMSTYIQHSRTPLENFRKRAKNSLDMDMITHFKEMYQEAARALLTYESRLGAIASKRAQLIYAPVKGARGKASKGLTREGHLELLSLGHFIMATNPTGLFDDDRIEFVISPRATDETVAEDFKHWQRRLSESAFEHNPVLKDWVEEVSSRVKFTLEDIEG